MATCTRRSVIEENRKQFDKVLVNTLRLEEDSPIILALKEEFILTFNDLHSLSTQEIDTLLYTTNVEVDEEQEPMNHPKGIGFGLKLCLHS